MCFNLLHLLLHYRGKFGQRENLSQVEFINGDMKRFNELVFSDNLYTVSHLSLVNEDTAYVVYKNLHSRPNPKGNIFVAAFTTAHARLDLYNAIEKLNERMLYMTQIVWSSFNNQVSGSHSLGISLANGPTKWPAVPKSLNLRLAAQKIMVM